MRRCVKPWDGAKGPPGWHACGWNIWWESQTARGGALVSRCTSARWQATEAATHSLTSWRLGETNLDPTSFTNTWTGCKREWTMSKTLWHYVRGMIGQGRPVPLFWTTASSSFRPIPVVLSTRLVSSHGWKIHPEVYQEHQHLQQKISHRVGLPRHMLVSNIPIEDPLAALSCGRQAVDDRPEALLRAIVHQELFTRQRVLDKKQLLLFTVPMAATERWLWRFLSPGTCMEGRNAQPCDQNAVGKSTGHPTTSGQKLQSTLPGPRSWLQGIWHHFTNVKTPRRQQYMKRFFSQTTEITNSHVRRVCHICTYRTSRHRKMCGKRTALSSKPTNDSILSMRSIADPSPKMGRESSLSSEQELLGCGVLLGLQWGP